MKIELATSVGALVDDEGHLKDLMKAANDYADAASLEEILFDKQPGGEFLYRVKSANGRVWKQDVLVPIGLPNLVTMDFAVPDQWALTEFAPGRVVRDLLVELAANHGVIKVKIEFP